MSKVSIPGVVYRATIANSQVPQEENWPQPVRVRVGKGERYVYEVTEPQRRLIVTHIEDYSDTFFSGDPEDRPIGHAVAAWLEKQEVKA